MEMERYAFISDNYEYQMRVCPSDLIIYLHTCIGYVIAGRRTAFAVKERKEIIEGG